MDQVSLAPCSSGSAMVVSEPLASPCRTGWTRPGLGGWKEGHGDRVRSTEKLTPGQASPTQTRHLGHHVMEDQVRCVNPCDLRGVREGRWGGLADGLTTLARI